MTATLWDVMPPGAGRVSLSLFAVVLLGCEPESRGPAAAWAESVAWLRSSADGHLQDGDIAAASADLQRALALPVPALPAPGMAEAQGLLQDVDFALGSVELLRGRPADAEAIARRGIARTAVPTAFLANLHALRGIALEAMARPLDAAEAYHDALLIHERLFNEALASSKATEAR